MFENGQLDSRQAKLPERLELPTVGDIMPGSAWYIDADAVLIDETGLVWVNKLCSLIEGDDHYITTYTRIIAFEEGLVLDTTNTLDSDGQPKQFQRVSTSEALASGEYEPELYIPIIAFISTTGELEKLEELFKERYTLTLEGEIISDSKAGETKESGKHTDYKIKSNKKSKKIKQKNAAKTVRTTNE